MIYDFLYIFHFILTFLIKIFLGLSISSLIVIYCSNPEVCADLIALSKLSGSLLLKLAILGIQSAGLRSTISLFSPPISIFADPLIGLNIFLEIYDPSLRTGKDEDVLYRVKYKFSGGKGTLY